MNEDDRIFQALERIPDERVHSSFRIMFHQVKLPALKGKFTEEESRFLGQIIVDEFIRCRWQVWYRPRHMHTVGGGPHR